MAVVILAALGLCSACLVVSLLFLASGGRTAAACPPAPCPPEPGDLNLALIQSLQVVTQLVRTQVGEHSESVSGVEVRLRKMQQDPAPEALSEVLEALNVLLTKNTQLQQRLNAADRELDRQNELLEHQRRVALTDPLTGLGNRRAFDEQFQKLRQAGSCLGIVLLDLDHFKCVNDSYGHAAGDAVLVEVGEVLRKTVRQDAFVARMGGEEFAVLVPQASTELLARISLRIREALEQGRAVYEGQTIAITTSIGAALELPHEEPAALCQRADQATYASKQAGRNCCHLHRGGSIEPVLPPAAISPPAPPVTTVRIAHRMELMMQIRHHLLEADLEVSPLSLVLLEVECPVESETPCLAIEDIRFQKILKSLRDTVREDDLIAECDAHRVAVLLPGVSAECSPIERLKEAVAACLEAGLCPDFGVAEAHAGDDSVSFVQRAESQLPLESRLVPA